jgi:bacteriocin-like protein
VKACKSSEELFALAKSEGHKLTEDELAAIAGGGNWDCTRDDICWTHESGM